MLASFVRLELVDVPVAAFAVAHRSGRGFPDFRLRLLRRRGVELEIHLGHRASIRDLEFGDGIDDHLGRVDDKTRVGVELSIDQPLAGAALHGGFSAQLRAAPSAPAETGDAQLSAGRQVGAHGSRERQDLRVRILRMAEDEKGHGVGQETQHGHELPEHAGDAP